VKNEVGQRPILQDISVTISTLGRPILRQCLRSIVSGSTWPRRIIVVDQSSSSEVAEWLEETERLGVDTLHAPSTERGRACAVNRAIERVETPFFAVTDDDCTVDRNWLSNMQRRLALNRDSVVTGMVEAEGEGETLCVVTSPEPAVYHRPRLKFDSLSGGNMGTSRAVVERVGMLDEDPRLRCSEDGEWAYRALRAGVPIVYDPEITVFHHGWRSDEQWRQQLRAYARSHGGFYGKYVRKGDGFIVLRALFHHVRALRRWIIGTVKGDRNQALIGRAYVLGLLPDIVTGFQRPKPVLDSGERQLLSERSRRR
jgi:GT2 family glycosyltransferase